MKTPSFFEFMSLERLVLKDFPRFAEIDHSIDKVKGLIYLKIEWCPCVRELPEAIGCLTALGELILIQGHGVCYLPDSIGNLRHLSRLVLEDTGLVILPVTIKWLLNLEYLSLVNCTRLAARDAVGDLKPLTKLDLSGTIIEELSLWNIQDVMLRINSSKIRPPQMGDLPLSEDIPHLLYPLRAKSAQRSWSY